MMSDQSPFPLRSEVDSAAAVTPEFADRRANELAVLVAATAMSQRSRA